MPSPKPFALTPTHRMLAGGAGLSAFMAMAIDPISGVFTAGVLGLLGYMHAQQMRQLDGQRRNQENLAHFLHGAGMPEDVAKLQGAAAVATDDLYTFLEAIKASYGQGESSRGTSRLAGADQQEAVSPGISISLSHDLGSWYAKLVFSGETGRQFLLGGFTQWKGKGATPQAAIEDVMKKCGASRQQRMIEQYAQKLVAEADSQA